MSAKTYVITSTDTDRWESCAAKTIAGAKRCATARFGAGYLSATISVGVRYDHGPIDILATRKNYSVSRWSDQI